MHTIRKVAIMAVMAVMAILLPPDHAAAGQAVGQPAAGQAVAGQLAAGQDAGQPAAGQDAGQPAAKQAVAGQPAAEQAVAGQPAAEQAGAGQPAAEQDVAGQPVAGQDAGSQAAEQDVLHLTLGDPIESEMGMLGRAFKEHVERESQGRIRVEISTANSGPGTDEAFQFHRVQLGRLDMAFGGVANLEPMVNALGVLTLPYLFANEEEVVRATSGRAAEFLNGEAEKAGLRILAWTYCGFRNISNARRPIRKMEDMEGLKFRVPQSFVMLETYRALGATPTPLGWNMTYNALKNNEVDGQCYDYTGFLAMRFHEAGQRHITELNYLYLLQPLVISQRVFERMHPDMQEVLLRAGRHVQEFSLRYQQEERTKAREALQAAGVQIDVLSDEPEWRRLVREKVWPKVVRHIGGKDVINAYLEAAGLPQWE